MAQSKKKKPSTFTSSTTTPTTAPGTASGETPVTSPSKASTKATQRELLKEMRAKEAREKKIRNGITIGVLAVVVLGLIAGLIWLIPTLTAKNTTAASSTDPYAITIGKADAPVTIDIYQTTCALLRAVRRAQSADLKVLTDSGTAKVVFHVMAFLDDNSNGTKYSTRAANAFVTVAQREPEGAAFNSPCSPTSRARVQRPDRRGARRPCQERGSE